MLVYGMEKTLGMAWFGSTITNSLIQSTNLSGAPLIFGGA